MITVTKAIEVYSAGERIVKAEQYFMKNNKWTFKVMFTLWANVYNVMRQLKHSFMLNYFTFI